MLSKAAGSQHYDVKRDGLRVLFTPDWKVIPSQRHRFWNLTIVISKIIKQSDNFEHRSPCEPEQLESKNRIDHWFKSVVHTKKYYFQIEIDLERPSAYCSQTPDTNKFPTQSPSWSH
jgi:hypothetical protein